MPSDRNKLVAISPLDMPAAMREKTSCSRLVRACRIWAREHGVADAVVDAIGRGEDPLVEADDERAVYTVARQLSHSGRLDQETYDAAHRILGDAGMVELVSLCGYYTLVSFLLNAFAVPLPPDAAPMWAES